MKVNTKSGFTLPVILVSLTGMLVLLGALLTIVTLERQTATAHISIYQADLAAQSALTEARFLLAQETANDGYVVFNSPIEVPYDEDEDGAVSAEELVERSYPFLAHGEVDASGDLVFQYTPLFSASSAPLETRGSLSRPLSPNLPSSEDELITLNSKQWEESAVVSWRYIKDENGSVIARYAYLMEDTEAYLDPVHLFGDVKADDELKHQRANERWPDDWPDSWPNSYPEVSENYQPPWPAPGLNPGAIEGESELDQMGIFTINDPLAYEDNTDFDLEIKKGQEYASTRDSLMAAMKVPAPLVRDQEGRLIDLRSRQLEENFTVGNKSYLEQAVIPATAGITPAMVGKPKLNLNALLNAPREDAVREMVAHISGALPDFAQTRKGGFPEEYEATLAANALDYADSDSKASVQVGQYRGVDSYPLVTEFLTTKTWEWTTHPQDAFAAKYGDENDLNGKSFHRMGGRLYLMITVEVFAELWNMSSQEASGQVTMNFDADYTVSYGPVLSPPGLQFSDLDVLGRPISEISSQSQESGSYHSMILDDDGHYYFPVQTVTLEPNEYQLVRFGAVRFMFDVAEAEYWGPNVLEEVGVPENSEDSVAGEYRLKWEGDMVDYSRRGVEVYSPHTSLGKREAYTKGSVCGTFGFLNDFYTGMGDVRMSYYSNQVVSDNSYPKNYSPNRRNVRYGSVYRFNPDAIYGRVLPSEWPDGGHDSDFNLKNFHKRNSKADERLRPDSSTLIRKAAPTEPSKSPVRISNLGRFFSETELGNVFDPVMWAEKPSSSDNRTIERWVERDRLDHGDKIISSNALGGGNTLRIGRPEHKRFALEASGEVSPGTQAVRFLDLFHCGMPFSSETKKVEGDLLQRNGHVNVNTAPYDVIRTLVAGRISSDQNIELRDRLGRHDERASLSPLVKPQTLSPPRLSEEADVIASAIIEGRPYESLSELSGVSDESNQPVFGNTKLLPNGSQLSWSDSAAEETFARLYNSSTVRSRNFRVHVIGQAVRELANGEIRVLSMRKKVFRVFCDPGERNEKGEIVPGNAKVEVLNEKSK